MLNVEPVSYIKILCVISHVFKLTTVCKHAAIQIEVFGLVISYDIER